MGLNFIIADDKEESLKITENYLEKIFSNNTVNGRIVLLAKNPEDVLNYSLKFENEINVYILDINFDCEINGIGIARSIREREPYAYIIFLTAYTQNSMLVFRYRLKVFDFLIKPLAYSDLEDCIIALQQDFDNISNHEIPSLKKRITIKSGYQDHDLIINDIIYIESYGPKLIIHLTHGQIESYGTLKDLENMLQKITDVFFRCHKSYVVNFEHIKKIDIQNQEVIMSNGDRCLISRPQKKHFKEYLEVRINKFEKN
ncbi:LytR/AlgR family response regulator transcription factor [Candidatus Clostridium stratigraminis]|uniref:Stage 0 sporulation protein A homolog n=1 Tax=Candidatus Clostridium stratigraminis TaxID=3381661 RepID=A0ABW8SZR3_9CLOT